MTTNAKSNLSADYKYAELPDGKMLRFPKTATDKEIQRAVRRELGLSQDDMVDAMRDFVEHVGAISESAKSNKDALDQVAESLTANSGRLGGAMGDAIKEMVKSNEKLAQDLAKAMTSQASLVSKLHAEIAGLNKTLDAALGQSLESLDHAVKTSASVTASVENSVQKLADIGQRLTESIEIMQSIRKIRKRAYPNRDGSWTMEPITH